MLTFLLDQPILISSYKIFSPQLLLLFTKTRIRRLEAMNE
jgi:hypothetical protein